ncbi:MAG: PEGA domain-containing protein [Beijerinckiaceae bacterium]
MKTVIKIIFAITASLMVANCATVTRGLTNQVQITSEPSGAEVRTSLNHACTTPCTLQVDRKAEFSINYQKPGYRDASVNVTTRIASAGVAGFAGNIIIGGIVGMGVDAATGSTLEHTPNPAHATLEKIGPPGKPVRGKRSRNTPTAPAPPKEPEAEPAAPETQATPTS